MAPFSLTSYKDAAGWADTIGEVVHDRRMPPWDASPEHGAFANDPSLPEAEKQLLYAWVRNGVPEGDPKDLPEPVRFTRGWGIPKPDLVVTMPKPFQLPATGSVPYQYITVDPGFREDKWVQATEIRPGNPAVVHHVFVLVQQPGEPSPQERGGLGAPLAVSAAGLSPLTLPRGMAWLVPAGSKFVFQLHYAPNGTPQTDQTSVGLVFADPKEVRQSLRLKMAIQLRLRIPPGAADYAASCEHRFVQDTFLHSLFPHMHLRGKSIRIEAVYPDGRREILLDVPRYRFDWQTRYVLAEPKRMPEGTVLRCEGHFDNSGNNPNNPDPRATVGFGEQTWDEMLIGYFDTTLAGEDLSQGLPEVKALGNGRQEVVFTYHARPGTKVVYLALAGEFNGRKPTGHKMDGPDARGRFTTQVELKDGRYEYMYVLEGRNWRADPGNPYHTGLSNSSVLVLKGKP
jgi:hypothetical protein